MVIHSAYIKITVNLPKISPSYTYPHIVHQNLGILKMTPLPFLNNIFLNPSIHLQSATVWYLTWFDENSLAWEMGTVWSWEMTSLLTDFHFGAIRHWKSAVWWLPIPRRCYGIVPDAHFSFSSPFYLLTERQCKDLSIFSDRLWTSLIWNPCDNQFAWELSPCTIALSTIFSLRKQRRPHPKVGRQVGEP